jgi:hypothetical protein
MENNIYRKVLVFTLIVLIVGTGSISKENKDDKSKYIFVHKGHEVTQSFMKR